MACFADISVSQGSVATYTRCGEIFLYPFNCKFTKASSSENFFNRLRIDRIMVVSMAPFFGPPCTTLKISGKFSHGNMVHSHLRSFPFLPVPILIPMLEFYSHSNGYHYSHSIVTKSPSPNAKLGLIIVST